MSNVSRLATFVGKHKTANANLPIAHTTDGFFFRTVMKDRVLKPDKCSVYQKPVLYFFYGRPAYRPHRDVEPVSLNCFNLVSFLLNPSRTPAPIRVLPFDSGAMSNGTYRGHLHNGMALESFELAPVISELGKFTSLFFGTNHDYYSGSVRGDLQIPPLEMEAQCYYEIARTKAASQADDRRSSVELQYEVDIHLDPGIVLAVILPNQFLDAPEVKSFIENDLMATPIGYACYHTRPAEDARLILDLARGFCKDNGFFN